jgi:hypothetical protein
MITFNRTLPLALLAALVSACGAEKAPPRIVEPPRPGVKAEPRWLTFTCVEPGCETTELAKVVVVGRRDIAIKRIVLSDRERDDVTFEPSREPPFVLKANESFDIAVTYRPTGDPRLGDVAVEVAYTDASASEAEDRVEPGTLELPVVRRLVGEPKLEVSPEALVFGGVVPTSTRTLPLTIRNAGFGNVGLIVGTIDSTHSQVLSVANLPAAALLPGESWDLRVTYRPTAQEFMEGFLTVRAAGSTELPAVVPVLGTSIPGPALVVSPAEGVDFGEVPVGSAGAAALTLKNRGTETLVVSSVEVGRGGALAGLEVTLPGRVGTSSVTLAPLASADIALRLSGQAPGELNTVLRMTSNDPRAPELRVPLTGLVTKPEVAVSASAVDFGAVPRGWSVASTWCSAPRTSSASDRSPRCPRASATRSGSRSRSSSAPRPRRASPRCSRSRPTTRRPPRSR